MGGVGGVATYTEIVDYLKQIPAASASWAEGLLAAGLSMSTIERVVVTMTHDAGSPLRQAEEGLLNEELLRINRERGSLDSKFGGPSRFNLKLRTVLNSSEQTRVVRLLSAFAQPTFEPARRFGKNGHAVMNAVRRVLTAYITAKVPVGGGIVEVGPDINNWLLSPTPSQWAGQRVDNYSAARPVMTPRDSVRVQWERVAESIVEAREGFYSADTVHKAHLLRESYKKIFKDQVVQTGLARGEYILSFDSNYDIAFSDMPVTMAVCGSRAWYGSMVRAKGLTRDTKVKEGSLPLMGVTYRVDWKAGRIDFRHPECKAFGYSHNVWEYMKYEEYNGFVWTSEDCHFVYSKGPETNDELLFFQVIRVPKVHKLMEPRFVEHPHAGMTELTSVWAVGDELDGLPRRFEAIKFHVDTLNFSKVLEKRRALDCKGSLAIALSLVRSTNVRMWMHGTPVGVNKRIEARLAEATAVVVEALVAEKRLNTNLVFERAMYQYNANMPKSGWFRGLLESVVDLKAASGAIAGPIMRVWQAIRANVLDTAISPLTEVKVGMRIVEDHKLLSGCGYDETVSYGRGDYTSECCCGEIAELRAAILLADGTDKEYLELFLKEKTLGGVCKLCDLPLDALPIESDSSADESIQESVFDSDVDGSDDTSVTSVELGDCWRDETVANEPEFKSMSEFVQLEEYLAHSQKVEIRIDSTRIFQKGPVSDDLLKDFATTRTKHVVLEFRAGRCVRTYGPDIGVLSALYDAARDTIVDVVSKGDVMYAQVPDGYYYSCNNLRVWNGPALVAAVEYALSYGVVKHYRGLYNVTLGVPGAGKTYAMMKKVADEIGKYGDNGFLVLSATKKSVEAAIEYGKQFGIDESVLKTRILTLDSYLMHGKFQSNVLYIDEFPMVHIGKVDAAASIAASNVIYLCGDARQIPYDPFCAEFAVRYATLGRSVKEENIKFLPETHRLPLDVCAMWLDQYPAIYPCSCCRVGEREGDSCFFERINDLSDFVYDPDVRYHTYKQDEKDELRSLLKMPGDAESLRARVKGGQASVHQDQGTTHNVVVTFRLHTDYDKNASPRNPSLYNRERYVLTNTTRHTKKYTYNSLCEEYDVVRKRIELSKDIHRRQLVRERKGLVEMSVFDML